MPTVDINSEVLESIVAQVGDLPAAPAVLTAAMNLTADLQSNVAELSTVISADQSLTANVLRISNSPYYGRSRTVGTVEEAIVVLGFEAVRSIVIAAATHQMFDTKETRGMGQKLWQHAFATAVCAREISRGIKHPAKDQAFIAALLHDIGKLIMIVKMPEWYTRVVTKVEEEPTVFRLVEKRVFNFDHCDVAAVLLNSWSFPVEMIRAVTRHHAPPQPTPGLPVPLAHVVSLSNLMAKTFGVGFADEHPEDLSQEPTVRTMSLDIEALSEIAAAAKERFDTEAGLFRACG